jgi:4'-phosphopantetheinyl transferase
MAVTLNKSPSITIREDLLARRISIDNPVLADRDVHVWLVDLDQPEHLLRSLFEILDSDERARADRFHFACDRKKFVVAHGILRIILGRYLGLSPEQLVLFRNVHGKPALAATDHESLEFNLSHSGAFALLAVTRGRRVGVDLEQVRPLNDLEAIAMHAFAESEMTAWRSVPPEEKLATFFRGWVQKEAYLKAIGTGLTNNLDQFAVSLEPGLSARLLYVDGHPDEPSRWSIANMIPVTGYVAAVVVSQNRAAELQTSEGLRIQFRR